MRTMSEIYHPKEDEEFMNAYQREYFRLELLAWKQKLVKESNETINHLQNEIKVEADMVACAANETDQTLALRSRDRARKLISKIESALQRIKEGSYGYCEETGEQISLKRLKARPIATLSIEAQERHERRERLQREC